VAEIAAALVPRLAAAEREHDLAGRFGGDNLALVADAGLLGLNVPRSAGGLGQTLGGTVEALRVLSQGSPSAALMLMMHAGILANYLIDPRHVPPALRDEYAEQRAWAFREALAGRIFGVANSETGAGANVKNSKAEIRDGRVYGVKSFCTMGTNADYYMVAARQGAEVEYWLVANDPEHVRVETPWSAMGMRSSESVSLRFDGARALAPLSYRGLLDGVNHRHWSTLSFVGVFIGIAESLLEEVAAQKSGILQQSGVVDLHLTLQACRSFLRHCVSVEPDPADDSYRKLVRDCKLYVTRALAQHASSLYIAQSGSSYRFESSVSRKLRDLLAGPAVRPPVGVSFDELWGELSR